MKSKDTLVIGVTIPVTWLARLDRERGGRVRAEFVLGVLEAAIKGEKKLPPARKPGRPKKEKQ